MDYTQANETKDPRINWVGEIKGGEMSMFLI